MRGGSSHGGPFRGHHVTITLRFGGSLHVLTRSGPRLALTTLGTVL